MAMKDETKLDIIKELAKGNVKIAQLILEVQGDNNYYENRNKDEKMKLSDEQISKAIDIAKRYMEESKHA